MTTLVRTKRDEKRPWIKGEDENGFYGGKHEVGRTCVRVHDGDVVDENDMLYVNKREIGDVVDENDMLSVNKREIGKVISHTEYDEDKDGKKGRVILRDSRVYMVETTRANRLIFQANLINQMHFSF